MSKKITKVTKAKVVSLRKSLFGNAIKTTVTLLVITAFLLSVLYLFQVQTITKNNFLIRKRTKRIKTLKKKNSQLASRKNKLTSLKNIEEKIEEFNFVKSGKISYVSVPSEFLTKRK